MRTLRSFVILASVIGMLAFGAAGLFAAAAEESGSDAMAKEMITDPTSGAQFTAPTYGGTLTLATGGDYSFAVDSFENGRAYRAINGVVEKLASTDWGVDRNEYGIRSYNQPVQYMRGLLAESWETPDALTTVFHLRPEARWQNKAPVNGRALVANDIVVNYRRYLGLDGGDPSPNMDRLDDMPWDSITAPDDSTVVFKLKSPHAWFTHDLLWHEHTNIYAPEQLADGTLEDWTKLVGTGPFMLTDVQEGSSLTWEKNPDYWGVDEKYGNQLPYIDAFRILILPDKATRLAAYRTGRVDGGFSQMGASIRTLEDLESLQKSNPDVQAYTFEFRSDYLMMINFDSEPLDDIRVRRAIQKAINLEEINDAVFGGLGNDEPRGMSGRNVTVYDDWPAEIQEAFRFDPAAAEALLDEAGRPRGDDGVRFSLIGNICCPQVLNATYYELVASYLADIGIDLQLEFEEGANYAARMQSADYDLATSEGASQMIEEHLVGRFTEGYWGFPNTRDAGYEAKFKEMQAADSFEEWERLWGELNFFLIENHWVITAVEPPQWNILQPWVQGWNGENMLGRHQYAELWARLWIDQDLKEQFQN